MTPTLRIASISDVNAIVSLVNSAYRPMFAQRGWTHEAELVSGHRTTPAQVSSLFAANSTILVLCDGSEMIACIHIQCRDAYAYLGMLATAPACQNRGLGKYLLEQAEQYAIEHYQVASFRISVLSPRAELIAFYLRRGYLRTGQVEQYPVSSGVGEPMVADLQVEALEKLVNR